MEPSSHVDPPEASKYRVPLIAFLAEDRAEPDDLVEMTELPEPFFPDARGEEPDRDWFAAGG